MTRDGNADAPIEPGARWNIEPWEAPPIDATTGMLTPEDVERIGGRLEPNSTAALLLYEHVWASRLQTAVNRAHGEVRFLERIAPGDFAPAMS